VLTPVLDSLHNDMCQALKSLDLSSHNLSEFRQRWRWWWHLLLECIFNLDLFINFFIIFVLSFFHLPHWVLRGLGSRGCTPTMPAGGTGAGAHPRPRPAGRPHPRPHATAVASSRVASSNRAMMRLDRRIDIF